jgi:glutamate/tyrosine decarboxylase-like PLP-dependent enzyme
MSELWQALEAAHQEISAASAAGRVTPEVTAPELRRYLQRSYDFQRPKAAEQVLGDLQDLLQRGNLHVTHPRYFGLFNPSVRAVSVAADTLVASFNPQLAVWAHSPAAAEIERHTLNYLADCLGFTDPDSREAHFTSGGQEANASATLVALTAKFPRFAEEGVRGIDRLPTLYRSGQGHDSFVKIAHGCGLGRRSVRTVPVDRQLRLDLDAVEQQIEADRGAGMAPFLLVVSAGTTSAGVIDPLEATAELARRQRLWLHVDAAWGGFAALSPKLRSHLHGIEKADSITWDAHKGLSVPMAAGMFFCRHPDAVRETFDVVPTYVENSAPGTADPYRNSMQWSRRFIGAKVFATLAELGAEGYAKMIEGQAEQAHRLRAKLKGAGWQVVNDTPLPLVCFKHPALQQAQAVQQIARRVVERGRAWISTVSLPGIGSVLRACVTSFKTTEHDLDVVMAELEATLEEALDPASTQ